MYIIVDNELVETSSKRQKTFSSFTSQTKNTNTAIRDHDASCSYTIFPNNLAFNLKEYAHPNWDSDIPCTMPTEKILGPYKQTMQTMFKLTRNNSEDMFVNASDLRLSCVVYKKKAFLIQFRFIQIK